MILEVSRSYILVELDGKKVKVPGEMFFPPNDKMGFAIYENEIDKWEHPYKEIALTDKDVVKVIEDVRQDFEKGGHTLEV